MYIIRLLVFSSAMDFNQLPDDVPVCASHTTADPRTSCSKGHTCAAEQSCEPSSELSDPRAG